MKKDKPIKYRKVIVNGNEYFVYDMGLNALGKRTRIYGKTKGELEEKVALEMENRKTILPPDTKSFYDLTVCYLNSVIGEIPPKRIERNKVFALRRYTDTLKSFDIDVVTSKQINDELNKIHLTISDSLFNEVFNLVISTIEFAHTFNRMMLVKENRIIAIERDLEPYTMTQKDYELIKEEIFKPKWSTNSSYAIYFIMELGLRVTEVCNLKWKDITESYDFILLDCKKGNLLYKRPMVLTDDLKGILREIAKRYQAVNEDNTVTYIVNPDDYIFVNKKGVVLNTAVLQHHLQNICESSGASDLITLNSLRMYKGERMLKEGATVEDVKETLGFSSSNYVSSVLEGTISSIALENFAMEMNMNNEQLEKLRKAYKDSVMKVLGKTSNVIPEPKNEPLKRSARMTTKRTPLGKKKVNPSET